MIGEKQEQAFAANATPYEHGDEVSMQKYKEGLRIGACREILPQKKCPGKHVGENY